MTETKGTVQVCAKRLYKDIAARLVTVGVPLNVQSNIPPTNCDVRRMMELRFKHEVGQMKLRILEASNIGFQPSSVSA